MMNSKLDGRWKIFELQNVNLFKSAHDEPDRASTSRKRKTKIVCSRASGLRSPIREFDSNLSESDNDRQDRLCRLEAKLLRPKR